MKKSSSLLLFFVLLGTTVSKAQTLELFSGSGSTANGPVITALTPYELRSAAGTASTKTISVFFENQQYSSGNFRGLSSGSSSTIASSNYAGQARFTSLNSLGAPSDNYFTAGSTSPAGSGISITTNYGYHILTDARFQRSSNNANLASRLYYGDIRIAFSTPVVNPQIHFSGLSGGRRANEGDVGVDNAWLRFVTELELINADYSLVRRSGDPDFQLSTDNRGIVNNSTFKNTSNDNNDLSNYTTASGAASAGTVVINSGGAPVSSVSFRVYLKGDGGNSASAGLSSILRPILWSSDDTRGGDGWMLSVSIDAFSIAGTVFHDLNTNTTPDGNSLPGVTVNLLNSGGTIIATTTTDALGNYLFNVSTAATYTVQVLPPGSYNHISSTDGTPADGRTNVTVSTGATTVTGVNFGLQLPPDSHNKTATIAQPPTGGIISLNGNTGNPPLMTGTDTEDGSYVGSTGTIRNPQGVKITSLPVNGVLLYNGTPVTPAQVSGGFVFANVSLFSVQLSGGGYNTVVFNYAYVDAGGVTDPTPATYTINWDGPLPVTMGNISAIIENNQLAILWQTFSETNNSHFEIEVSQDGHAFTKIGEVASKAKEGNSTTALTYDFTASSSSLILGGAALFFVGLLGMGCNRKRNKMYCGILVIGMMFFIAGCTKSDRADTNTTTLFLRIAQVDTDGKKTYSKVVKVIRN